MFYKVRSDTVKLAGEHRETAYCVGSEAGVQIPRMHVFRSCEQLHCLALFGLDLVVPVFLIDLNKMSGPGTQAHPGRYRM